mgnify:CR=1 FL=1
MPLLKSHRPMCIGSYSLDERLKKFKAEESNFDFEKYFDEEIEKMMTKSS